MVARRVVERSDIFVWRRQDFLMVARREVERSNVFLSNGRQRFRWLLDATSGGLMFCWPSLGFTAWRLLVFLTA